MAFPRETFFLAEARAKTKSFVKSYPKAAYMSEVEGWLEVPRSGIELTICRLTN
jgi:hypothetical protein